MEDFKEWLASIGAVPVGGGSYLVPLPSVTGGENPRTLAPPDGKVQMTTQALRRIHWVRWRYLKGEFADDDPYTAYPDVLPNA